MLFILLHINNLLVLLTIFTLGYTGYYEIMYFLPMDQLPISYVTLCHITMDTNISLHLDAIANVSHKKIYGEGVSFTVLVIPNPSNANSNQSSEVYNVSMTPDIKQKYGEKYLPKGNNACKLRVAID